MAAWGPAIEITSPSQLLMSWGSAIDILGIDFLDFLGPGRCWGRCSPGTDVWEPAWSPATEILVAGRHWFPGPRHRCPAVQSCKWKSKHHQSLNSWGPDFLGPWGPAINFLGTTQPLISWGPGAQQLIAMIAPPFWGLAIDSLGPRTQKFILIAAIAPHFVAAQGQASSF